MVDVREYEAWLAEHGFSRNTIEQRTRFARSRLDEWGRLDVPATQLAAWLGQYNGWTRITYHGALNSLYSWAVDAGRVQLNPLDKIKRPPTPKPRPKPLNTAEEARILGRASGDLRLWLLLGLRAGFRLFEIAKLSGEECDEQGFYFVGKGGQLAFVPMHPDVWPLLQERPRTGWVFPSPMIDGAHITKNAIDARVRTLFRSVGVSGGIHRTRATYGTTLLRNGANIRVVQELMRHRSLASTEHYLFAAEDELSAAIRTLGAA